VVAGIEAALLVGQWAIFLTTIQGNYETALVYLPLPCGLLVVFALVRQWLVGAGTGPEVA
ncbi:MAG: hypothetical protein IMY86_14230, partial [Chloroflexi bacterium]|nr:hypothetical protein [Chloroflexota bacterium]